MNLAAPMTSELTMNYVGKKQSGNAKCCNLLFGVVVGILAHKYLDI